MDDLISRKEALEEIGKLVSTMSVCVSTDECRGMNWMKQRAIKAIENLPTAEKVGKWINYKDEHCCSVCDWVIIEDCWDEENRYDYCPYCGARMEGEEDECCV